MVRASAQTAEAESHASPAEVDRAQGVTLRSDGSARVIVWAPRASGVELQISSEASRVWTEQAALPLTEGQGENPPPVRKSDYQPEGSGYPLSPANDGSGNWWTELPSGTLKPGTPYR